MAVRKTYTRPEDGPDPQAATQPQAPPRRNPEKSGGGVMNAIKWMLVIGGSAIVGHLAVEKYKDWRSKSKGDDDDDDELPERNRPHALPAAAAPNILPFPYPFSVPTPMPMYSEPPSRNRRRRDDDDGDDLHDLLAEARELKKTNKALERENRKMAKTLEIFAGDDD